MGDIFSQGHALIIGAGADLPNTVTDAEGIANILKDPERCAYPPQQVRLLTSQQATRQAILEAFDALTTQASADATVVVYLSCHGYREASPFGTFYYLMPNGYDIKQLPETAISGAEFTQKLQAIPAQKLLVLLDCCHAGGLENVKTPGTEFAKAPLPPEALEMLKKGKGKVLIASSREDELSYAGKPYSAFTHALLETLCGVGVAKRDGYVRVTDLALHAGEVVPRYTSGKQHPILNFEHADNFTLAYYAGGQAQPKALPFPAVDIDVETAGTPLNQEILLEISSVSLNHHRQRFGFGYYEKGQQEILRDELPRVLDRLVQSVKPVIIIQGPSGIGKSTLLRQIGQTINENGGIALWLPAEKLVGGISLQNVLLQTLQEFRPDLDAFAGDEVIRLNKQMGNRVVLLIDDINRIPGSRQALDIIRAWTSRAQNEAGFSYGLRFIVPLWPDQKIRSDEFSGWDVVDVAAYSADEKSTLANLLAPTRSGDALQTINALSGDPFLCGLASDAIMLSATEDRPNLIRHIFDDYIEHVAEKLCHSSAIPVTPNEGIYVLDALVELMLATENPEPEWSNIRSNLGYHQADILHALSRLNALGWIEKFPSNIEYWRWKHNRLRNGLVGRWLAQNVLLKLFRGETSPEIDTWLSDPGLSECWALSTVFLPDLPSRKRAFEAFAQIQPLILADILWLGLFPTQDHLRKIIAKSLQDYLESYDERSSQYVSGPWWWILDRLSQTNDLLVLEITRNLTANWAVLAARTRNGDIEACIKWLDSSKEQDFVPSVTYSVLEHAIEMLRHLYTGSRDEIAIKLASAITNIKLAYGAITLAGYLAWPELARPIREAWSRLPDEHKTNVITPAIWALSRCGSVDTQQEVEAVLLGLQKISEEEPDKTRASERYNAFTAPMRMAARWSFSSASLDTWVKVAQTHPELENALFYVLRGIDHPATMEAYIRWSTQRKAWVWDDLGEPLNPLDEWSARRKGPTNPETRERLWQMVITETDKPLRVKSFQFWFREVETRDLDRLCSIIGEDPLFEDALKARIKLRDPSAASLLIRRMSTAPGEWCCFAPFLISEDKVFATLVNNFEAAFQANSHFPPYSVIRHLPANRVIELLKNKQEVFRSQPWTWNAVWRTDIPDALVFVQELVSQADTEKLEFFAHGHGSFPYPVSQRMLNAITPILKYFSEDEQRDLADLAHRNRFMDWLKETGLDQILHKAYSHHYPMQEDIINTLSQATETISNGIRQVRQTLYPVLYVAPESAFVDIPDTLREWMGPDPSDEQLIVASIVIAKLGKGEDIQWWQTYKPTTDTAQTAWQNALMGLKRYRWQADT